VEFKRANIYKAAFFFIFASKIYIELAMNHHIAVSMEYDSELQREHAKGQYPPDGLESQTKVIVEQAYEQIHTGFWGGFFKALLFFIIALAVAAIYGSIHPSFEINHPILMALVGIAFGGWATIFSQFKGYESWKGQTLHELLHTWLFSLLVCFSIFFGFLGLIL